MKRKIFPLLAALFLTAAMTACADPVTPPVDPDALTIMGKKSDLNKPYMTRIFEKYQADTGNKLRLIEFEDSQYEVAAAQQFAEGKAPDIFQHFHNADLSRFDVEENFLYLGEAEWADDLTDSARAYCTDKNGNLLGLPFWESSVSGCYYNKTLLNSLGLEAVASQQDFDGLCAAIKENGYTPICWPGNGCSWMPQFGLDPIFADDPELLEKLNSNEISLTEIPAVENMVQWIADAEQKGWFGNDYLSTGWNEISSVMGSGEAVMTFIWDTWFYTDFSAGQKYSVDDFALMPVFLNTVEGGTYEGGNLNMMMVNKNGEKLQKALDFLSYCATPENYNYAFDGISTVSCFKGQTTNIQSKMVTDATADLKKKERVSTAATKIIGYSAEDVSEALIDLLSGRTNVKGCVKEIDDFRKSEAKKYGASGF